MNFYHYLPRCDVCVCVCVHVFMQACAYVSLGPHRIVVCMVRTEGPVVMVSWECEASIQHSIQAIS